MFGRRFVFGQIRGCPELRASKGVRLRNRSEGPSVRRVRKEDLMLFSQRVVGSVLVIMLVMLGMPAAFALTPEEAVGLIATRLDQSQIKEGPDSGLWSLEGAFLGPIASGLACAYEWTEDPAYRACADLAGGWILDTAVAQGNLLGDEAYALVRLSKISDDPNHNVWQNALVDFYLSPRKHHNESSTEEYLLAFDGLEPSTAVFYLAHHLVGADYVQDQDTEVYRRALLSHLSRVDDNASFPVMAVGVATWALTVTDTPVDSPITSYELPANPRWEGLTVGDLPAILASHQVPEGEPFAGSFYWRLDHTDGETGGVAAGYTEDTVFGALGLVAVASEDSDGADEAVIAAQTALLEGIDEDGYVYQHLTRQGDAYNTFAGEVLQALWSIEEYLGRDAADDVEAGVVGESE